MQWGGQSGTAQLRRVLVRAPRASDLDAWRDYGWRSRPDPAAVAREHEELCELLERAGAEVVRADSAPDGDPDAIYVYDPALVSDRGAVLLRPGKPGRLGEPASLEPALEASGIPIAARLGPPATAEGGDLVWLDERTLLAGLGYRTNEAGVEALRAELPGVDVLAFDLPHLHGAGEVLHLLSLLSPLADDLVVAHLPLLPVRLVQLLEARGIRVVEVPDEEFDSMGPNVLALAPRVALALERNVETRRRLEQAGVEVLTYRGEELSKGDGGPTCLTLPLLRA
ncbi:MAG TPA: arginine deiminase family protein [Gaiellaceae bacterium]